MATVLLSVICLIGLAIADGNMATVESSVTNEDDSTSPIEYFTDEWREEFSEEQLSRQPKWILADDKPLPLTGDRKKNTEFLYQVREYAPAWFVTSYTPCLKQTNAVTYGYMKAYLYMNRYNRDYARYNLTYPIINKIELHNKVPDRNARKEKTDRTCRDRFSVNFYLPHPTGTSDPYDDPAKAIDESIIISEVRDSQRRFVFTYEDTYNRESVENCNDKAEEFAQKLSDDGRRTNPKTYYCAIYEPNRFRKMKFELWFDDLAIKMD